MQAKGGRGNSILGNANFIFVSTLHVSYFRKRASFYNLRFMVNDINEDACVTSVIHSLHHIRLIGTREG